MIYGNYVYYHYMQDNFDDKVLYNQLSLLNYEQGVGMRL